MQCYHTSTSRELWLINPYKIQEPACQVVSLDYVDRFIIPSPHGHQGKIAVSSAPGHQGLASHCWVIEKRMHLMSASYLLFYTNSRITFLSWGPNQPAVLAAVQQPAACSLLLVSHDSNKPSQLLVPVSNDFADWSLWQREAGSPRGVLWNFGPSPSLTWLPDTPLLKSGY